MLTTDKVLKLLGQHVNNIVFFIRVTFKFAEKKTTCHMHYLNVV